MTKTKQGLCMPAQNTSGCVRKGNRSSICLTPTCAQRQSSKDDCWLAPMQPSTFLFSLPTSRYFVALLPTASAALLSLQALERLNQNTGREGCSDSSASFTKGYPKAIVGSAQAGACKASELACMPTKCDCCSPKLFAVRGPVAEAVTDAVAVIQTHSHTQCT